MEQVFLSPEPFSLATPKRAYRDFSRKLPKKPSTNLSLVVNHCQERWFPLLLVKYSQ